MVKIKHLVAGEFLRLTKYNLFTASLAVALIWVSLGFFLQPEEFMYLIPFVFLMETSAMTALLVGAEMYYEKKEHTISSMLISPISSLDYIVAKVLTSIINVIFVFGLISVSLYFLKDITFNYGMLLLGIFITVTFYVFVGILLSYISKDFTALLMNYMLLMIVFLILSMLLIIGFLPAEWKEFLFWFPTEVTIRILMTSVEEVINWRQFGLDSLYIIGFSVGFLKFLVLPHFKDYATANLGV